MLKSRFFAYLFVFLLPFVAQSKTSQYNANYVKCNIRIGDFGGEPLIVGISPDFPPFEFLKNNKLVGFDVDLTLKVAQHIGKDIIFRCLPFSSIVTILSKTQLDMAVSAINITEKRMQNKLLSFSMPYYNSNFGIIFNKYDQKIKWGDVAHIAVQEGTAMEIFLRNYYKNSIILTFPNNNLAVQALKSGLVNFVLLEWEQAKGYVNSYKKFSLSMVEGGGNYVFAFPSVPPLINIVNNAIKKLNDSGVIDYLSNKWFINDKCMPDIDRDSTSILNNQQKNNIYYLDTIYYIFNGVWVTIFYALISIIGGLLLGCSLALVAVLSPRVIKLFISFYISVFRGTPLLLQLGIIYFTLPNITGSIPVWVAGILSLSLNSSAYMASIVQGGIVNFDPGQLEAADSLNLSTVQKYRDIVLPQIFRHSAPSFINEVIDLIKESAIISVIGGGEIMHRANTIGIEHYNYFFPLAVAGIFYYTLSILTLLLIKITNKKV
ncbi:ABC transporter substrate-binding protein/permease [Candidatus Xenohaliotis californiensis]|uniref:ABC transporter substrate-binding protein/permease n=1 Tax=Candidatus Xenohaliotis californiensis TaxID=84677 RepID=UPI0030C888C7